MEHRWGTRKPVTLHVRWTNASGTVAVGTLRDISVSGAFIATNARVKIHEQVQLTVYSGPHNRTLLGTFEAHVVRTALSNGVGIEWSELAPEAFVLLERQGTLDSRDGSEGDGRESDGAEELADRRPGRAGAKTHRTQLEAPSPSPLDTDAVPSRPRAAGLRRRGSRLR